MPKARRSEGSKSEKSVTTAEGTLRVWHVANPPRKPFALVVGSLEEAKRLLDTLANYDLYLGDMIDYNAQGVEVFENGEWLEWESADGDTFSEVRDKLSDALEPCAVKSCKPGSPCFQPGCPACTTSAAGCGG